MIQKVSFRNFRAYRSLDLELEPFTVLVGPNASGKTTLLEGFHLISSAARNKLGEWHARFSDERAVRSYGSNSPVALTASGVWGGTPGVVRLQGMAYSVHTSEGTEEHRAFEVSGEWGGRSFPLPGQAHLDKEKIDTSFSPPLSKFQKALGATAVLRFEPRRLVEPSYSAEENPSLSSDGTGLASVLAHFKLSRDEVFGEIEDALRQIVPAVRRIRIERAPVKLPTYTVDGPREQTVWGNRIVLDMRGAKGVRADAAGEGTLMALGLFALVMGPAQPSLVLLDDIELGLHPAAQGKLIEILRKIQARDPELQIVATSHSPFILNYLDPKEVRMTFLAENGFSRCEKLTAHPEFERWKDLMSPGEFWSTVGESWLETKGETASHE
ncbi:MAG TPA: AAA family ATPase [Archangium sp.]|nr:AAA family ATPase [Archangium sp.]